MSTVINQTIRNGVDTATLFGTLDAVKAQPELGRFQFRATTSGSTAPITARRSAASSQPARRTRPAPSRSSSTPVSPRS